MKFYCLQSSYIDGSLSTLELNGLTLLLGASLPFSKLLTYLPNFGQFLDDRMHDTTLLKDKLSKTVSSSTPNKMQIEPPPIENSYYAKINEQYYLKTSVKYDISAYDNIDLSKVDCIVLSNLDNLYALPYLTECTKFKGRIYSTTPVRQIAFHFLKELQELTEFRNKKRPQDSDDYFQESEFLEIFESKGFNLQDWLEIYSLKDIESCFQKIEEVSINQVLSLNETTRLRPISSGYSLGSSNWVIETLNKSIAYISRTNLSKFRHSMACDLAKLKQCSVMILEDVVNRVNIDYTSKAQENSYDVLAANFVEVVAKHLNMKNSGNILLPISSPLFILDFVDIFRHKLSGFGAIHIISSSMEALLAYSNTNIEYLNPTLVGKIYTQYPENPFSFDFLEKNGRFFVYNSIDEFQERNLNMNHLLSSGLPNIFIVGHSSFRLGFAGMFFDMMEKMQDNIVPLVLLTDPYMQTSDLISSNLARKCKIVRCPLDANVSMSDLSQLLVKEVNPEILVVPREYKVVEQGVEKGNVFLLSVGEKTKVISYKEDEEVEIELKGGLLTSKMLMMDGKKLVDMKAFKLNDIHAQIYLVEGELKKNEDGEVVVGIREAKDESGGKGLGKFLNGEKLEQCCENFVKEMELQGFIVMRVQKNMKVKGEEVVLKAVFKHGEYYVVVNVMKETTKVFYSHKCEGEIKLKVGRIVADCLKS